MKILAITGGVGGAKLALGLATKYSAQEVAFLVNTGDDFEHLGLPISPDVDTLLYTLAGLSDPARGWGRAEESWNCLHTLSDLGQEAWFQLGDKDLALHLVRKNLLADAHSQSEVIDYLRSRLGIDHAIFPMSDSPVRTKVKTTQGEMEFQQYFVKERCEPTISGFRFDGAELARPVAKLLELAFESIILCPSNPYVSVDPILAVPGMKQYLQDQNAPIVAVSPIIQGKALKGPAAKMMHELGFAPTSLQIGKHYAKFIDGLIIDQADATSKEAIEALGIAVKVEQTVMSSLEDRVALACSATHFAAQLAAG